MMNSVMLSVVRLNVVMLRVVGAFYGLNRIQNVLLKHLNEKKNRCFDI